MADLLMSQTLTIFEEQEKEQKQKQQQSTNGILILGFTKPNSLYQNVAIWRHCNRLIT